ncbi:transmembrane protein 181 isoform X1 [Lates japonicus]|uniref:Transmembrane protein 181 isoform X1 n=1 Tax=Lates japonicus TaxID=270547 RepID=A0AAD3NJA7_LATJO|nr:transmembrane protein 181 isoform X1 [Lates japonicus]
MGDTQESAKNFQIELEGRQVPRSSLEQEHSGEQSLENFSKWRLPAFEINAELKGGLGCRSVMHINNNAPEIKNTTLRDWDPFFPLSFLVNSWFPGTLDAFFQVLFLCALAALLLCVSTMASGESEVPDVSTRLS